MAIPDPARIFFERHDDTKALISELIKRVNEDTRRIRIIEQRIDRIESSVSSIQEDSLNQINELKLSLEKMTNKLSSISEKLANIESEILRLSKELSKTATKRELKQMETFIDLINPITAKFVTRDEMEKFVNEKIPKNKKA